MILNSSSDISHMDLAKLIELVARFLALVTTMVTKVDHGNYGWLPRLVTMVSYLGYQGANHGY